MLLLVFGWQQFYPIIEVTVEFSLAIQWNHAYVKHYNRANLEPKF